MLSQYAEQYEHLYKQPKKDALTIAVGCVAGQQVTFNVGRNIRRQLFELCGHPIDRNKLINSDLTVIKNLTSSRIRLLKEMAQIDHNKTDIELLEDYRQLAGFGKWTLGAVSILLDLSNDINLSSDAYIRKNLNLYTDSKMNEKQCYNYLEQFPNQQTKICYFLWRIKPQSIYKIKQELKLNQNDFV